MRYYNSCDGGCSLSLLLRRWAFLFDKVLLLCKKMPYKFFDVRYAPKQWYFVSDVRVEPVQPAHKGKVGHLCPC